MRRREALGERRRRVLVRQAEHDEHAPVGRERRGVRRRERADAERPAAEDEAHLERALGLEVDRAVVDDELGAQVLRRDEVDLVAVERRVRQHEERRRRVAERAEPPLQRRLGARRERQHAVRNCSATLPKPPRAMWPAVPSRSRSARSAGVRPSSASEEEGSICRRVEASGSAAPLCRHRKG